MPLLGPLAIDFDPHPADPPLPRHLMSAHQIWNKNVDVSAFDQSAPVLDSEISSAFQNSERGQPILRPSGNQIDFGTEFHFGIRGYGAPIKLLAARELAVPVFRNVDANRAIAVSRDRVCELAPKRVIKAVNEGDENKVRNDFSFDAGDE